MVCLLPAQQTDHVCERGRLRAAPVAAGALEAPRQAREREGYGPTKLAEPLVCGSRVADFGSCPCVYGDNLTIKHPLTGEPDAGDPPVRFGGRGSANTFSLPLFLIGAGRFAWAARQGVEALRRDRRPPRFSSVDYLTSRRRSPPG